MSQGGPYVIWGLECRGYLVVGLRGLGVPVLRVSVFQAVQASFRRALSRNYFF